MGNSCSQGGKSFSSRENSNRDQSTKSDRRKLNLVSNNDSIIDRDTPMDQLYEQALPTTEADAKKYDYLCKILLLGDSEVGKSSVMRRYTEGEFSLNIGSTIGLDFKTKIVNINNKKVKVQLWDTAGQERFQAITRSYYKGIHCYIIVFDITKSASFNRIGVFLSGIKENGTKGAHQLLLGNKVDLSHLRAIETQTASDKAAELDMNYLETSAKTGECIEQAINQLVGHFVTEMKNYEKRKVNNNDNDFKDIEI